MIVHHAGRRARAAERLWLPDEAPHGRNAVLKPIELLFRVASGLRNASYDAGLVRVRHAAVPVISVGNLTVGGTGKTPFVRWLVQTLAARGARPAILHGGYGADEPELLRA
jgi:tetraacyldisaccharide 4'-kinase